jgi:hypothetical protein
MAEAQPQDKKTPFRLKFAIFSLMVAGVVFFPTTVLFAGCLVPTFVAALVDAHPQKTSWITVGCMNFAGALPAWFSLWEMGHHLTDALQLLIMPRTLIMAYGGAGVGWIIYGNVTPFVARLVVLKNEMRVKDIDKRQKELIRKWGQDVAG